MTERQGRTKSQPHRYRVSVPGADKAVVEWMSLQDNASVSIRLLIRESIERIGYVDVMNRPVDQLPKRGRPRTLEEERDDAAEDTPPAFRSVTQTHQRTPSAPHQTSGVFSELGLAEQHSPMPELLGIGLATPALVSSPIAAQDPADRSVSAISESEQPSSGQQDVNDIFAGLRQ